MKFCLSPFAFGKSFRSGIPGRSLLVFTMVLQQAHAVINISDGSTLSIATTVIAPDDYNTDHQSGGSGGILEVASTGRLVFNSGRTVSNTHGNGTLALSGTLEQNASSSSNIYAAVNANSGAVIQSLQSSLYLRGGGNYASGASLLADGGSLYLHGGTHNLNAVTLNGANWLYSTEGTTSVAADINPASGPTTGNYGVAGGTVNGTGMLSAERGYFSTGTISGGVTLRLTGNSTKVTNTNLNMNGGTIRNEGTFNCAEGGDFNLDSVTGGGAGTLLNHGNWTLAGACTFSNTYGSGQIVNHGTFSSNAGSSNILAAVHHQAGSTFRCSAASILLSGGGTVLPGSTLDANGGHIYFYGGTHTLSGGTITGTHFVYSSTNSTTTITGNVGEATGTPSGGYGIAGGTVNGSAMLSAERGYFSGGTISGNVILRLTGNANKAGNSTLNMNGGTIRNEGTFTCATGGDFNLDSVNEGGAGTLLNHGNWTLGGACTFGNTYGGGQIINHGTFSSDAGANNIVAAVHHQAGSVFRCSSSYILLGGGGTVLPGSTLDANGGHIYFNGGIHTLSGGTITGSHFVYSSSGTTTITGNVGEAIGTPSGGYGVAGGLVNGSAMLSAERGYFSTGTISGSVTLRLTGNSNKAGNSTLNMNGGTIRNEGTFTCAEGGDFNLDSVTGGGSGTLLNHGNWTLAGACTFSNTYGGGQIINHGTFSSNAGANNILAAVHHQAGSVFRCSSSYILLGGGGSVLPGSTLDANGGHIYFNGGIHTLSGGTLTGSHFVYSSLGTAQVTGDVGASTGPATGGFGISGGTVNGTAMLSADHGYFSTGTMSGGVTLRLTGNSNKAGNTNLNMNGGTIRNEGTFTCAEGGNFNLDSVSGGSAGTLLNHGAWTLAGACTFSNTYGSGQIINHGTFNSDAGASNILAAVHHQAGSVFRCSSSYILLSGGGSVLPGSTLDANGGHIYFYGGIHTLSGGTITGSHFVYSSLGTTQVTGDVGASTGPATGGFGISGGTVNGTAMLSADHGYFSSGTMSGSVTLRLTGNSSKAANTTLNMNGGTIRNEGSLICAAGGDFNLDSNNAAGAGAIVNQGTWTLAGGCTYSNTYNGGTFTNSGTLRAEAGASVLHTPLTNGGSTIVDAGSLTLSKVSSHSGALIANGSLILGAGTHTMSGSGASLGGSGSAQGNLSLSNGARIAPGNPVGNFTHYGSLQFIAGGENPSVAIDFASTTSYDSITLGNSSQLALGTGLTDLNLQLLHQPTAGAVYRIISAGTGSGTFTGRFRNAPANRTILSTTYQESTYYFQITYDTAGKFVDLVNITDYHSWALAKGLTGNDTDFDADPDRDGVSNGIEFILGGEPNPSHPGWNSVPILPAMTLDATHVRLVFRRQELARDVAIQCQYSSNFNTWTHAQNGMPGVSITETLNGISPGMDRIEALIPRSLEQSGRLFARIWANR